jgi:hypothetical protein
MEIDVRKTDCEGADWIQWALNRVTFGNMVQNV